MKKLSLLISLTLIVTNFFGQTKVWTDESKINWLKKNAVKVESISPADTNFADLQSLKDTFKNVNIVMLGEAAHGEGTTTSAKIRLIKFLHEQMGFDMMAFESPFYDFHRMNDSIKNGMSVDSALSNLSATTILATWAGTNEFDPLLKYINDSYKKGKKPISFCGFDNQCNFWAPVFKKDIDKNFAGIDPLSQEEKKVFYSLIDTSMYYKPFPTVKDSLEYFKDLSLYIDATKKMKDKEQGSYWLQVFKSLKEETISNLLYINSGDDKPWYKINNPRDAQMADNLIWLVEHNPNKKFIVWAASNHLSRNLKTLKEVSDTSFYAHYHPMGEHIKNKYGDKAYSMGFTSAGGTWYAKGMMPKPKEVKPVINNSIECLMQRADFTYGFINYRSLTKDNFLNQEIFSNPFGHAHIKGVWTNVLDGIFFVNEVVPPTFKW